MTAVDGWRERHAFERHALERRLHNVRRRAAERLLLGELPTSTDLNLIQEMRLRLNTLALLLKDAEELEGVGR